MKQSYLSWIILIVLSLVWGSSFMLMKKGLVAFSSDEVAALRIGIAFLFMLPFMVKHYKINLKKYFLGIVIMGVVGNLIPAFLFTKAETQISSSLAGMLNALTPFFTMIIGYFLYKQAVYKKQLLGVLVGFMGALGLLYVGHTSGEGTSIKYCLYVVIATVCYALSINAIKRYLSDINSITATVWSFTFIGPIAIIYLFSATDFQAHLIEHPKGTESLLFISILAIVGSALSVIVYNMLIKQAGTVFAASCTYFIPVVAIFWGLLDNETVNIGHLIAIAVIVLGVWLINKGALKANNK